MNRKFLIVCCLLLWCETSQAQGFGPLQFELLSPGWQSAETTPLYTSFENPSEGLKFFVYTDPLAFNDGCGRGAPHKDVRFDVVLYKTALAGEPDAVGALDHMLLEVIKGKRTSRVKAGVIDRYHPENFETETGIVRLGRVGFISPYSCQDLDGSRFVFSGMSVNGAKVSPLELFLRFVP